MKKLLILLLLLGFASTAGAEISLQIDGSSTSSITIDKSMVSVVEVQVYSDDSDSWLGYCILNAGSAPGAYLTNPQKYPAAGDIAWIDPLFGIGYEMSPAWVSTPTQPGLHFTMDLDITACSFGDSGVISLWDDDVGFNPGDEVDYVAFTVVPEPSTILLLALGSIFLKGLKK